MGPAFVAAGWMIVVGMVFVPAFIASWIMLRSPLRTLALAATFCVGALAGFAGCMALGSWLMSPHASDAPSMLWLFVFATACAIGAGVIAVWMLGRFSRYPPWRRY